MTINEFIRLTKTYAASLNKSYLFPSGCPTYDWLTSFLKRHMNLVLKNSRPLEKKRALVTQKQIDNWFDLISKTIKENGLEHHPGQIYNADESGKDFFL